jgi:hypothetical protein
MSMILARTGEGANGEGDIPPRSGSSSRTLRLGTRRRRADEPIPEPRPTDVAERQAACVRRICLCFRAASNFRSRSAWISCGRPANMSFGVM